MLDAFDDVRVAASHPAPPSSALSALPADGQHHIFWQGSNFAGQEFSAAETVAVASRKTTVKVTDSLQAAGVLHEDTNRKKNIISVQETAEAAAEAQAAVSVSLLLPNDEQKTSTPLQSESALDGCQGATNSRVCHEQQELGGGSSTTTTITTAAVHTVSMLQSYANMTNWLMWRQNVLEGSSEPTGDD
jgi:hypothetical protein